MKTTMAAHLEEMVRWCSYLIFVVSLLMLAFSPDVARAKHEVLLFDASPQVTFCVKQCHVKSHWSSLPTNRVLSLGDWLSLPKGTTVRYRVIASTEGIQSIRGPRRFQLRHAAKLALSQRLAALWRRVVRRLRGRALTGTGATRAPTRFPTTQPKRLRPLTPYHEELRHRPKALVWQPQAGAKHYQVRVLTLSPQGAEQVFHVQKVSCSHARKLCQASLMKVPLQRGIRYFWQIRVWRDVGDVTFVPEDGLYFRWMTRAKEAALQRSLRGIQASNKGNRVSRELSAVLYLLDFGAFSAAEARLARLKDVAPSLRQELRWTILCATGRFRALPSKARGFCGG